MAPSTSNVLKNSGAADTKLVPCVQQQSVLERGRVPGYRVWLCGWLAHLRSIPQQALCWVDGHGVDGCPLRGAPLVRAHHHVQQEVGVLQAGDMGK